MRGGEIRMSSVLARDDVPGGRNVGSRLEHPLRPSADFPQEILTVNNHYPGGSDNISMNKSRTVHLRLEIRPILKIFAQSGRLR